VALALASFLAVIAITRNGNARVASKSSVHSGGLGTLPPPPAVYAHCRKANLGRGMICGVFTIPQGYIFSLNFTFEIHTRHLSNFSLPQLPASFGLPLGSSLFLTLQLWYTPKSTLHSRETSAFSKSRENVVEWRLEPGSTNFAACNISLQKVAIPLHSSHHHTNLHPRSLKDQHHTSSSSS
jgi:hypothetical protein